ncbi:MAG: hypothetical protein ACI9Q4_000997, partial [Sediminicola sp.]
SCITSPKGYENNNNEYLMFHGKPLDSPQG